MSDTRQTDINEAVAVAVADFIEQLDDLRAELAEEKAAHAKTRDNFETCSEQWQAEVERLRAERDTAVTQASRQDAELRQLRSHECIPTQWAYDQACKALEKHRARADAAEAEVDRERGKVGDLVRKLNDITRGQGEVWPAGASLPAGPPLPRRVPREALVDALLVSHVLSDGEWVPVDEYPALVRPAPMTDPALEDRTEGSES